MVYTKILLANMLTLLVYSYVGKRGETIPQPSKEIKGPRGRLRALIVGSHSELE